MNTGVFGTIKPADINPSNDVEILYFYRPTRSTEDDDFKTFKELSASECLVPTSLMRDGEIDAVNIAGVYNLRLPLDKFGKKGFYTIYIRPKELTTKIVDVSSLANYSDIRGVVFNNANGALAGITDMSGYRIQYDDGSVRLITSCNRCEPVVMNVSDGYPKITRYNLVDTSSDYVFCTVTPSSTASYSTSAPYIGRADETVKVVNTKFSPKMIEIEMVENDADTIATLVGGDQARDRDNAILTIYNDDKEIYQQYDYYTKKDTLGNPLYDIKQKRENIDSSQSYDNVIED